MLRVGQIYLGLQQQGEELYVVPPSLKAQVAAIEDPYEYAQMLGPLLMPIGRDFVNPIGRCWFRAKFPLAAKAWGM